MILFKMQEEIDFFLTLQNFPSGVGCQKGRESTYSVFGELTGNLKPDGEWLCSGLERWLRGLESVLVLYRTPVQCPAPLLESA